MMYYYVLWIPQQREGVPTILHAQQKERRLRDFPWVWPLYISGIIKNNYDIKLSRKKHLKLD